MATTVSKAHSFQQLPQTNIGRSAFDLSHSVKTSFYAGLLVPVFCDEVIPGDTWQLQTNSLLRLGTPMVPFMDNVYVDFHYWFVPARLVWKNWKPFMGEKKTLKSTTDFVIPTYIPPSSPIAGVNPPFKFVSGSVGDYFGLPVGSYIKSGTINVLPFRSYQLIWNEFYRDQNLQEPLQVSVEDTGENVSNLPLLPRGKRHDYFTSCLPWSQKGNPVSITLGISAPVVSNGLRPTFSTTGGTQINLSTTPGVFTGFPLGAGLQYGGTNFNVALTPTAMSTPNTTGAAGPLYFADQSGLQADLRNVTALNINQLRQAFAMQAFLEKDARSGTRYTEMILAHFGVSSPDARQQRPEYLGGGTQLFNTTPVPQTSSSTSSSPQGTLGAFSVSSNTNAGFEKSFTEHGYIIGLASARIDQTYQEGIRKMWTRSLRYDFAFPVFAHLGEQTVLNKELFNSGNSAVDDGIFGYQERYAEYRYKPSHVTGRMRSKYAQSLHAWHLAQDFSSTPVLNDAFIREVTMTSPPTGLPTAIHPLNRVLSTGGTEHHIFGEIYFRLKAVRPLPTYSIPGLAGHF
jgi:hypothetical protein